MKASEILIFKNVQLSITHDKYNFYSLLKLI